MRVSPQFLKQMQGYGLTTAHILYRTPDFRSVLQTYVWQDYDLQPDFPQLKKFLKFWTEQIEGAIHQVIVGHSALIKPAELKRHCDHYDLRVESMVGLRPTLSPSFFRMLFTRKVPSDFAFRFSKSLALGYCGIAQKNGSRVFSL